MRELVVRAYDEARARRWPFLSDVLERALEHTSEEDRAVAAAAVQALVKYDRLLAFVTGSEAGEVRFDALWALARGDGEGATARPEGRGGGAGRGAWDAGVARIERIENETERLGVTWSMPDWLVDRVRGELGRDAPDVLQAALARMNEPAPRFARVNTLRTTREACLVALAEEGVAAQAAARASTGVVLGGRRSIVRTQAFARGDLEMQDEASQLVAELVAPPPRSFVVDACAGAGGKTLALAALLAGKGKLVALDTSESKLDELRRRARRAGATNVQALAVDLRDEDAVTPFRASASRVLVDAPCTGLGAIRRNPEARWRLREDDLSRLVAAQGALIRAASRLVAPHGRLIYATCSFLPSEGEAAIESFLAENADFRPVTVRDVLGRSRTERVATPDGKYLRTWRFDGSADGGDDGMDGFFAAVARRQASRT